MWAIENFGWNQFWQQSTIQFFNLFTMYSYYYYKNSMLCDDYVLCWLIVLCSLSHTHTHTHSENNDENGIRALEFFCFVLFVSQLNLCILTHTTWSRKESH